MKLAGSLVPVSEVTRADRNRMFALMDRHFENVQRSVFESDLDEKQWVIKLCHPRSGELLGFSTQMLLDATLGTFHHRPLFRRYHHRSRPLGRYRLDARLGPARPDSDRPKARRRVVMVPDLEGI